MLADKIAYLRKQRGWSQEELAVQMCISRQSVSKWESGASIPDLDRIIKMSQIFDVSTDYLLRDEIPCDAYEQAYNFAVPQNISNAATGYEVKPDVPTRVVSRAEVEEFLQFCMKSAKKNAFATMLCILSPVCLILLGGYTEASPIDENLACGIGVVILFVMIGVAVALFTFEGLKREKYKYLETEMLEPEAGVTGFLENMGETHRQKHRITLVIGVVLCVICPIPLFVAFMFDPSDMVYVAATALLLVIVAVGVYLIMVFGGYDSCCEVILEKGDYSRLRKKNEIEKGGAVLHKIYWGSITAIYLLLSFLTGQWGATWVIWPCAGVFFGVVKAIQNAYWKKKEGGRH